MGKFQWRGYDGSALAVGGDIRGVALNNWSGTDHSMGLQFFTTPSASTTQALVGQITAAGNAIWNGTITNDSASAGQIGEFAQAKVAAASAINVTTATPLNVITLSLTAGDWDVQGNVSFYPSNYDRAHGLA